MNCPARRDDSAHARGSVLPWHWSAEAGAQWANQGPPRLYAPSRAARVRPPFGAAFEHNGGFADALFTAFPRIVTLGNGLPKGEFEAPSD